MKKYVNQQIELLKNKQLLKVDLKHFKLIILKILKNQQTFQNQLQIKLIIKFKNKFKILL